MADDLKIMPVQSVGAVTHCMAHPQSYATYISRWPAPTAKQVAAHALQKLEEARAKDVENHEKNISAIAANKAIREKVERMMSDLGFPKSYGERDAKSRARFPKMITHDAGYLGDLRRHAPVTDGFDHATGVYERLKKDYDAYAAEAAKEDERAAAERERAEQARKSERRKNLELAGIILRYDLDPDAEWSDILDHLRRKDQRLDLAVAMLQTRGDWSEGYYRVSDALSRFKVNSPQDAEIQTDILSCFNDDIDGRVFRDTTWSYDRLFASVEDTQLTADVQTALNNVGAD